MKVHLLACLLLGLAGLQLAAAQKEYPNMGAALKANDAKLYLEAARRARFDDQLSNGNTIATGFIPSDKAFNRFLKKVRLTPEQFYANNTLLVDVLMYHVVPGSARDVKQLTDKMVLTSMRGKPLTIAKSRLGDIIVMSGTNGKVIKSDMKAGAAVVHIVDDMLLPKDSLAMYALQQAEAIVFFDTLDDAIQAEDSITTFANMLDEAGLLKLVTSPGTSGTLFAPTNDALDAFFAAIEANGGNLTKVRSDKEMLADLCKQHITSTEVFRMAQLERMNNKDIQMSTQDNVGVVVRQEELPPPATAAIPALPTDPAAAAAMAAAAPPLAGSVQVLSPYAAQFSNDPTYGGMADPAMAAAAGMPAAAGLGLPGAAAMPGVGAMQQPGVGVMQQPGVGVMQQPGMDMMQQPGMAGVAAAPAVSVLPAATQQPTMFDPTMAGGVAAQPAGFAAQPGLEAQPGMMAPQVAALPQQQFSGMDMMQPAAQPAAAPGVFNQLMGRRLRQAAATTAADAEPAPIAKPAAKAAAAKPAAAAAVDATEAEPAAAVAKPAAKAGAKPAAAAAAGEEAAAPAPASNNTVTRVYLVDMFNITSMVQPSDRIGGAAVLHILDGVLMPPSIANYLDDIYNTTTGGRAAPRARRANRTATTAAEVGGNTTDANATANGTAAEGSRRRSSGAAATGLAAPLAMALLAGATTWAVLLL